MGMSGGKLRGLERAFEEGWRPRIRRQAARRGGGDRLEGAGLRGGQAGNPARVVGQDMPGSIGRLVELDAAIVMVVMADAMPVKRRMSGIEQHVDRGPRAAERQRLPGKGKRQNQGDDAVSRHPPMIAAAREERGAAPIM